VADPILFAWLGRPASAGPPHLAHNAHNLGCWLRWAGALLRRWVPTAGRSRFAPAPLRTLRDSEPVVPPALRADQAGRFQFADKRDGSSSRTKGTVPDGNRCPGPAMTASSDWFLRRSGGLHAPTLPHRHESAATDRHCWNCSPGPRVRSATKACQSSKPVQTQAEPCDPAGFAPVPGCQLGPPPRGAPPRGNWVRPRGRRL